MPSMRCKVLPSNANKAKAVASVITSALLWRNCCKEKRSDSVMRAAALPVGAAKAMRGGVAMPKLNKHNNLATVVVLPVPGPPVMMANWLTQASAAACCCSLLDSASNKVCNRPDKSCSGLTG